MVSSVKSSRQVKKREQRNLVDVKSCEEIVYNFKKGSFSAMAWAIGRLKGVEEIIAFKMLR